MGTIYHSHLSVRGALRWPKNQLRRWLPMFTHDDGTPMRNVEDLREALMDELSQGHEAIKLGTCDNFDPKTGCKGHPGEPDRPIPCPHEGDKAACDRCWASHEDAVPYCTDDYGRKRSA